MRNIMVLVCLVIALSGCASKSNYYKDSNMDGYTIPHFNILCENCNKPFTLSQSQFDKRVYVICPNCGYNQNIYTGQKAYRCKDHNHSK